MKPSHFVIALFLSANSAIPAEPPTRPAKAPAVIELRDQYDAPQRLAFPATNVVVLTIADRKGSEQIDGWVTALKARYAGRIEICGLADVGGVPGLWRGKVRKQFQETRKHPVMMDWSGKVCARFGFQKDVANLLILGRDGALHARFTGAATPAAVVEATAALDKILSVPAKVASNEHSP